MTKILDKYGKILYEEDVPLREFVVKYKNLRWADFSGAKISGKKILSSNRIGSVGQYSRELLCFFLEDKSFYFLTGCFRGKEKEITERVKEKYGDNCEYIDAIKFLKKSCKRKYQQTI